LTVINDLEQPWSGIVRFELMKENKRVQQQEIKALVKPFDKAEPLFTMDEINEAGKYTIEVTLVNTPYGNIKSVRDFIVR